MNKKGDVPTLEEIWGLIKAGAIILIVSFVFVKMFFFVNTTYASSKSSLERFQDVVNLLENDASRSLTLDLEKETWLFGFNKDQNYIKYRRTDYVFIKNTYEQSKPRSCDIGKACLCLCSDDCKKFTECKVFEDIDFFVVTDISDQLNGGLSYEFDGKQGNYLAMSGQGVVQMDLWREDDIIYIGQQRPETEQVRGEFERFAEFAQIIGERRVGTCKLVFEIDQEKMGIGYFIMVYTDGNAKLFSGQGEQIRNIAAQEVGKAAVISVPLVEDDLDQIFGDSYEEQMLDFIIDPYAASYQEHQTGVTEGIIGTNQVTLIQRDGKWLWSRYDYDFIDLCV